MGAKRLKRDRVLDFIKKGGERGRSFTEIQRFVCRMNGIDWDEREKTVVVSTPLVPVVFDANLVPRRKPRRRYRGYWCTNLLGGCESTGYRPGILPRYCLRNGQGNWVLDRDKGPDPQPLE